MDNAFKIIGLAFKTGSFLALPILVIGTPYWFFSQGSFDKVWEKLNQISGNQTFVLLLVGLILFVILSFGLAWLWFLLESRKPTHTNTPSLIPSDSNESQKKTSRNPRKKS